MLSPGSLCYLPGIPEPVEVAWLVGPTVGVRVPWSRAAIVIDRRYLTPCSPQP